MNDEFSKKVEQISNMLGQDIPPDNLKELISLLSATLEKKEAVPEAKEAPAHNTVPTATEPAGKATGINPVLNNDILDSARKALDRMSNVNDIRINLLHAISPFMNSKRRKKIGDCIQLLQVVELSRILNDQKGK